jgi:16S rRNA (cytidine1402-2'-O)-methyltransferase
VKTHWHKEVGVAQGGRSEPPQSASADRVREAFSSLRAVPLQPGLHLIATPIGNLGDVTLRALAALERADVLYCEDTRHSRKLLTHYGMERPTRPYHEHNAERERPRILADLASGKSVALISDAGTPLVSDPGFKLVRAALDAGHTVTCLPGPSAVLTAVASAGLATDTFLFGGFLPPRHGQRLTRLQGLAKVPATLVLFEAPTRLAESLADIAAMLGTREVAVARELTKLHEEVRRGTPKELALWAKQEMPKGEVVIVVGPPEAQSASDDDIAADIAPLLADMTLAEAAKTVAEKLGVPKSRAYDIGLLLKRAPDGEAT